MTIIFYLIGNIFLISPSVPETEPMLIVEEEDVYVPKESKAILCCVIGEPQPWVM